MLSYLQCAPQTQRKKDWLKYIRCFSLKHNHVSFYRLIRSDPSCMKRDYVFLFLSRGSHWCVGRFSRKIFDSDAEANERNGQQFVQGHSVWPYCLILAFLSNKGITTTGALVLGVRIYRSKIVIQTQVNQSNWGTIIWESNSCTRGSLCSLCFLSRSEYAI